MREGGKWGVHGGGQKPCEQWIELGMYIYYLLYLKSPLQFSAPNRAKIPHISICKLE